MVNLDKVKLVLWDFDDTLCIHTDHTSAKDEFDTEYNVKVLRGEDPYTECFVSEELMTIMHDLERRGVRQGLISATRGYVHAKNKEMWVREKYGVQLENHCVSNSHMKLGMLLAIAEADGLNREEILIVDDYYENLTEAADAGFQAAAPLEMIAVYKKFGRQTVIDAVAE